MSKTITIIKTTLDTERCRVNDAAHGLNDLEKMLEKNHTMQWEREIKNYQWKFIDTAVGKSVHEIKKLNLQIESIY